MVNESIALTPKKGDDSNDEDGFYQETYNSSKPPAVDSSDDDTTLSSLLPIPDTLAHMRDELKCTINNICLNTDSDPVSPKTDDFTMENLDLATTHPTETEASIARKITSANIILDNLMAAENILGSQIKDTKPLVFSAKNQSVHELDKTHGSRASVSDPSSTDSSSTSSGEHCRSIAVTPFIVPAPHPVCECARCPCEKTESKKVQKLPRASESCNKFGSGEPWKTRNIFSLSQKMKNFRLRYNRKKKQRNVHTNVDESQQTYNSTVDGNHKCIFSCENHNQTMGMGHHISSASCDRIHWVNKGVSGKCTCSEEAFHPPFGHKYLASSKSLSNEIRSNEKHPMKPIIINTVKTEKSLDDNALANEPPRQEITEENVKGNCVNSEAVIDKNSHSGSTNIKTSDSYNVRHTEGPKNIQTSIPVTKVGRKGERIDIYYFDHGNSAYYRTTDSHPSLLTENLIEKTDVYASRFWAELFGTITVAITFVISFILQLYRCLFTSIIRALIVGLIQIFSDYFFKPLLAVVFNGLLQPCLILGYNIATSLKDFCIPLCEICEFFAKDLAIVFGSCRLIEVNRRSCSDQSCSCRHNV